MEAEVIYNDRGSSKGFGFITMASRGDADNALSMLHRTVVDGRLILVNYATPKKPAGLRSVGEEMNARPERFGISTRVQGKPRVGARELVQAELNLAQAQLQVDRLREELCSQWRIR